MHRRKLMWLITLASMFELFPSLNAGTADSELSSYEDVKLSELRRIAKRESSGTSSDKFLKPQADEGSSITKRRAEVLHSMIKNLNGTVEENQKHTSDAIIKLKEDIMVYMVETNRNQNEKISSLMLKMEDSKTKNSDFACGATRKEKLLNYLHSITGSKTISGLYCNYQQDINKTLETISSIAGVLPGIITTRMPIHTADAADWQSFIDQVISTWNNGYLVHIVWDTFQNPLSSNKILKNGSESEWNDLIQRGGNLNKAWKKELDVLAPYLKQLQNAGVVPIVDILSLTNLKFTLWSGRPGSRGTLKLYQITHNYLTRRHGLNSLIWAWSVNYEAGDSMMKLEDYWPGKNYVDVAAVYLQTISDMDVTLYQSLLNVVGDVPISMEAMEIIPSAELLVKQSEWAWFTIFDNSFSDRKLNSLDKINATIHSESVINRNNNEFFQMELD